MIEDLLYGYLKYYSRSPQWLKSVLGNVYKLVPLRVRYGGTYTAFSSLLKKSEKWSSGQLADYQNQKLTSLVRHAYEHVPYYRESMMAIGLTPSDIKSVADLCRMPFLTKENILDQKERLVASNIPRSRLLYYSTGGTTGVPMSFYNEKGVSRSKELAFMTALWQRVGFRIGDPIVTLRGNVVPSARSNRFYEVEPIKNRLVLSTYHMTDDNLATYVEQIRAFSPKYIHTYPSAVTILGRYMIENDIQPFATVKAVLCSSEAFYPGQRELLEKAFQCRIFSWYGMGEMVALAGECEHSSMLHIFPEYGIVELVNEDNQPIDGPGTLGEIVGTGFDRDIMPFIRYRTGDFGEYSNDTCSCGRNYRLLKRVEGRWLQEQVFTKKGNQISITALNMHSDIFENVQRYQFYQNRPGCVELRIVPKPAYSDIDSARIIQEFERKFDKRDIDFEIRPVGVEEIQGGRSGKFRFLIQNIKLNGTSN